ncbi:HNH endonuclease [bacterium]|nr:HNH endonuclease [bacterium]
MTIYRRIYEQHHGSIPRDENGRSYDIHHIDGNRKNNDPNNLIAVSILEHYRIHLERGDWNACVRILARIDVSPQTLSELARKGALKRIKNGTHNFVNSEWQRSMSLRQIERGTHPLLGGDLQRKTHQRRLKDGTHHLLGPECNKKMLAEGKHPSQIKIQCPHCGKIGGSNIMKRWHFDKCKSKPEKQ